MSQYETKPNQGKVRPDLLKIASWIEPSSTVLDLGCGDGVLLEHLQNHKDCRVLGVEIVDERKPADHMGSLPADGQLAAAIQAACFNNKLLLEKGGRNGTVIRLLCPLIITQAECEEVIVRFKKAIAEALVATRGA